MAMLPNQRETVAKGAKTARMEQRTTPQTKELIEQAATLLGINPSEFMIAAAVRAARATVSSHERTMLTPESHAAFLQALDAVEPTSPLKHLMQLHADVAALK
jgi:uncharacterized protein (DUF1778 family)